MATRINRLSEFLTEGDPPASSDVQLLCEDHVGTYVLPFPCQRAGEGWRNSRTGEALEVDVVGWRDWNSARPEWVRARLEQ